MADTYRVRLVRNEFEFEVEGPREFVDEMLGRFVADDQMEYHDVHGDPPEKELKSMRAMSPSEFIRRLGFAKHTDKVLAFGHFLEQFRDQSKFTSSDINALYYEAKLEAPNTSQMLTLLVKRGHLMQAPGGSEGRAKSYTLTQSGMAFIEKELEERQ